MRCSNLLFAATALMFMNISQTWAVPNPPQPGSSSIPVHTKEPRLSKSDLRKTVRELQACFSCLENIKDHDSASECTDLCNPHLDVENLTKKEAMRRLITSLSHFETLVKVNK